MAPVPGVDDRGLESVGAVRPLGEQLFVAQALDDGDARALDELAENSMVVREATVGPEFGTLAVSGRDTLTRSNGSWRASAAICEKIVFVPWPISVEAASASMPPSRPWPRGWATAPAIEARLSSPEPVKPEPWKKVASPMPRFTRAVGLSRAKRARLAW